MLNNAKILSGYKLVDLEEETGKVKEFYSIHLQGYRIDESVPEEHFP